ncbi:hypothetical protein [Propylenella binzhouense]|uniref:Uncharacterized protein n=1 Tax=Propylenella binzhouense TaxID=2555902 RepID=A0A964WRT7_9HYPH|nr:hypothetical protein [Propylenella binzhouense]MYZ46263.1 hypothetical protein [Propylenella binzhouense]
MKAVFLGAAAIGAAVLATPAQAQSWTPLVESRGLGRGAVICDNNGTDPSGNYLCLALRCMPGGPLEFAMIAEGGDFGDGSPVAVTVGVDGRNVGAIVMRQVQATGQKRASVPYEAAAHRDIIAALRGGSGATLTFFGTTVPLSLRGSARQIDHAFAVCQAAAPQPAAASGNLTAADVRTQLIGRDLAWEANGQNVVTVYLPNGRFEGVLSGRANNGTYRVEADGRLCWQSIARGCFRFYRDGGALWVKRDDPQSQTVLGRVTVQN